MKKVIIVCLSIFSCSVYSAPMREDVSICYKFNNEKLVNKSTCIINSGYGAGGSYISIEQGKTTYNVETINNYNEKTDEYEESQPTLNSMPATYYHRDLFYKKITDSSLITDDSLNCIKTKNLKIDICYK